MLLKDRYEIVRELGRGAFGVVMLARDRQLHDRSVVVKVLLPLPESSQQWAEDRFREECEALARISHPGVVTVLDQGVADGHPFIVMQFVDGPTLRHVLNSGLPTLSQTAQYAWEIGDALAAAHDQRIAHRDLKPENIMLRRLPGGRLMAVVLDFGISGVLSRAESRTESETVISGTPSYMAPEQFDGRPLLVSDIYSFGVVLYEMVTGRRPFLFQSIEELRQLQEAGQIESPRRYCPSLPQEAEQAILRALSYRPEDRHSQALSLAEEFIRGLRRGDGTGRTLEFLEHLRKNPLEETMRTMFGSVREPIRDFTYTAVLEEPTSSESDVMAASGATEVQIKLPDRMISKTANRLGLFTQVARGRTQFLKGPARAGAVLGVQQLPPMDFSAAGRDECDLLSVLMLLNSPGTRVQSVGSHKLNGTDCEAVALHNDANRWSFQIYTDPETHLVLGMSRRLSRLGTNPTLEDTYSDYREVKGAMLPFQILSRSDGKIVSRTLMQRMDINVGLEDATFDTLIAAFEGERSRMTVAEDCLQKGYALLKARQFEEAASAFTEALGLRADYFEAHKCLGFCYGVLRRLEPAVEQYTKALQLHAADAEAFSRRGELYRRLGQYESAIRDLNKALEIDANRLDGYGQRALVYRQLREYEKAEVDFTEVLRRQPGFADAYYERGANRFLAGRYADAVDDLTQAIRLKPNHNLSYSQRGAAFMYLKQVDRARDDFTMAIQLNPADPEPFVCRAMVYAFLRQPQLALGDTNEAIRLKPNHGIAHWHRAAAKEKLGDIEGASRDRETALRLGAKPPKGYG